MHLIESGITRRDVIEFYVKYDRAKKPRDGAIVPPLEQWPWTSCRDLDRVLESNRLKSGCMPAYCTWSLFKLGYEDLLDCAIDKGTAFRSFDVDVQSLRELAHRGLIDRQPEGAPEWWGPLSGGADLPREWALILRPSTIGEKPAKWYVEDGTGRALALVRAGNSLDRKRAVFAYVADATSTDDDSEWLRTRPELRGHS